MGRIAGIVKVGKTVHAVQVVGLSVSIEISLHVIRQHRPLGANDDVGESHACADDKARTAVLEPVRPCAILENNSFTQSNIEQELGSTPYSIVHVASHGKFQSDVQDTFLLTYDGKLNMDTLEGYMASTTYRDQPVELLTLSACQTAVGDDKAALGLGGVAVKAGARSAIATLWYINDQASSLLVSNFYENLKNPQASKARIT